MNVAIIGTGYVGLVTGACLAHVGHHVIGVDCDARRVAALTGGACPLHEPGLPELVTAGVAAGRLAATASLADAVRHADVVMICVGTPSRAGRIDLDAVRQASQQIGAALKGRRDTPTVVVKSTVLPGTTDFLVRHIIERASRLAVGSGFGLAMNPEFLSQGSAVRDFLDPDRLIVGAWDEASAAKVLGLYDHLRCPKVVTNLVNAELMKYAANAFQATLISFSNQIAGLCEKIPGADESEVMRVIHLDRILAIPGGDGHSVPASRFLQGGIGFGGSCFPKDVSALRHFAQASGIATPMLDAVMETNGARPAQVADLLAGELGGLAGRVITILGLTFKPHTDDLRESPGLALIDQMHGAGAILRAHDPLPAARQQARALLAGDIRVVTAPGDALSGADAAVIATGWPDYLAWDWPALGAAMRRPLLLDGRNLFGGHPPAFPIVYRRVGVGPARPHDTIWQRERDQHDLRHPA